MLCNETFLLSCCGFYRVHKNRSPRFYIRSTTKLFDRYGKQDEVRGTEKPYFKRNKRITRLKWPREQNESIAFIIVEY